MKPLLYDLFQQTYLNNSLLNLLDVEPGQLELRSFPDGETYIQFQAPLKARKLIFLATLNHPNDKLAPLLFAAATAKSLGAKHICLIAPYLAYMRQDKRFHSGEGITSKYFAQLLSQHFDQLITIDPHLHRYKNLNEIYSIQANSLSATKNIAEWIKANISQPVFIGPDMESEQWVKQTADLVNAPYQILKKIRHGDEEVSVSKVELSAYKKHTPILLDDIVSTGHTMLETIKQLNALSMQPAVCIAVHAIFAGNAYPMLQNAGIKKLLSCNTIPHPSNAIDLASLIANNYQRT